MVRELMEKLAFKNTIAPLITLSPFEVKVYIVAAFDMEANGRTQGAK